MDTRKTEAAARSAGLRAAALAFASSIAHPLDFIKAALTGHWRQRYRDGTAGIRVRREGDANPAGSKLLRRFYRAKHGVKESYEESLRWYSKLLDY